MSTKTRSTLSLIKYTLKDHSFVKRVVRELSNAGDIKPFETSHYTHPQNKQTYEQYLIDENDLTTVVEAIKDKPKKKPLKKRRISKSVRAKVVKLNPKKCAYCDSTNDLCLDHIIPESAGGKSVFENLQILCRSCNSKKGTKSLSQWRGE